MNTKLPKDIMKKHATAPLLLSLLFVTGCYGEVHEVHEGRLEQGDTVLEQDGSLYDSYEFKAKEGYVIVIDVESSDFDAYAHLMDADGNQLAHNDDAAEGSTNARVEFTAPASGTYFALANTFHGNSTGAYKLTINAAPKP
jgi:hypothetical protein